MCKSWVLCCAFEIIFGRCYMRWNSGKADHYPNVTLMFIGIFCGHVGGYEPFYKILSYLWYRCQLRMLILLSKNVIVKMFCWVKADAGLAVYGWHILATSTSESSAHLCATGMLSCQELSQSTMSNYNCIFGISSFTVLCDAPFYSYGSVSNFYSDFCNQDYYACFLMYPPFNHRSSSFSGRCFPAVEHSATELHLGAVTDWFWGNAWRLISSILPSPNPL